MADKELLCPCGSKDYTTLFKGTWSIRVEHPFDFQILRCASCGLARTYPVPYDGNITTYESPEWATDAIENETVSNRYIYRSISSEMLKEIEREKDGDRLLDIGCGVGNLLDLARSNSWDTYGVELSQAHCKYAESIGLKVANSTLNDAGFKDGFFDAISMVHLLEHIPQPLELLKEARRILKPDGILVIDTPDISTLTARFQKERCTSLDPDCHIWQFTPKTLKCLLVRAGFTPKRMVRHSRGWRYWKSLFLLNDSETGTSRVRSSFRILLMVYGFFNRCSRGLLGRVTIAVIKRVSCPLFRTGICGDSVCIIARKANNLEG